MSDPLNRPRKKPEYPIALATILGVRRDLVPTQFLDGKKWWFSKKRTSINWVVPLNIRIRIPYFFTNHGWLMGLTSWVSTNGVLDADCSRLILDRAASGHVAGVSNPHCLGSPWCSVAWSTMPVQNVVSVRFPRVLRGWKGAVLLKNN